MVEVAKVKLVSIVIPYEIEAHLRRDLKALGVHGYTATKVDGYGAHGARTASIIDGANVRFDVLARADMAEKVLEMVARTCAGSPFVAYTQDVEAIPREHFA